MRTARHTALLLALVATLYGCAPRTYPRSRPKYPDTPIGPPKNYPHKAKFG